MRTPGRGCSSSWAVECGRLANLGPWGVRPASPAGATLGPPGYLGSVASGFTIAQDRANASGGFSSRRGFTHKHLAGILMLTFMDEFRAPSRPVRRGATYDVPVRASATQ